jgi:hypothetical protein
VPVLRGRMLRCATRLTVEEGKDACSLSGAKGLYLGQENAHDSNRILTGIMLASLAIHWLPWHYAGLASAARHTVPVSCREGKCASTARQNALLRYAIDS